MATNMTHMPSLHNRQSINGAAPAESESQELTGVLQKIVQNAGALLDVNSCSIALTDMQNGALITRAAIQKNGHRTRQTRFQLNEGVAGWVAENRQPLIIKDARLDPRFKRLGRSPVGSIICVPLIDSGNFIGTLTASSSDVEVLDEDKLQMLTIFAEQAVLAIMNARHAELAQRQTSQLEMLLNLSQDLTTRLESEALYRTILVDAYRLVPCQRATIYSYDVELQQLCSVAELLENPAQPSQPSQSIQPPQPIPPMQPSQLSQPTQQNQEGNYQVLTNADVQRECISLYDETSATAWAGVHRHPMVKASRDETDVAEITTPLVSKNVLYGVIVLQRRESFTSEELRLVRNLSNMAAAALENMELFQKVRSDQEQLRAVLQASSDGIAIMSATGSFVEVNPAFGQIFGLDPQQMVGMEYMELFDADEELPVETRVNLEQVSAALQQQQMLPHIEIDLNVNSVPRSIGISVTPVTTVSKPFSLVIARDVTAIRDATRIKANFLSMITHELRSPLNAINGYLDLALAGIAGDLNAQQREFVQRARASSENLYALVEDLLFISRADSGRLRLSRDITSLREIVANAVEELELMAVDNNVSISVTIATDFPPIYADAVRLQQVLRNLLSNALRFTPPGGGVAISASTFIRISDADPSLDQQDTNEKMALVTVHDTGCGIPSEYHEHIFERFYQVTQPNAGRVSGQGLGLAIVKMIVELHGGQITVESTPGEGSTFSFTLPCLLS